MKAIILAAGKGTRMGDLTKTVPKPLLKIKDKTLLEYKLDILSDEFDEVVIVIGYLGDTIKNYLGDSYKGKKLTYVTSEPLGTGHAVWSAKDHLTDSFVVMCGDDLYSKKDIEKCLARPFSSLVFKTSKPQSGGKIVLNGEFIADIVEGKHDAGIQIATGLYHLQPEIFKHELRRVNNGIEFGLPQTLLQVKDKIRVIETEDWYQVTAPDDLNLDEEVLSRFL